MSDAATPPLLEVRDLGKRFGGLTALSGVSFSVAAGETVGIMGANGAGKTTLFSLIAGNARPSARAHRLRRPPHRRPFARPHLPPRHRPHLPDRQALPLA